ncbi:hypothetical protein THRCLA_07809 [Thraustotheca clavata]|uniref:WRKY19-like zinc finger domain-containing protein n=1 Tax=Thraustotheca clavata TaxID=74557 RepID=A0A1V9ZCC7_9STRA|nr:hypothetical protein THRCLA_07809 [Thraustotheca clavata]
MLPSLRLLPTFASYLPSTPSPTSLESFPIYNNNLYHKTCVHPGDGFKLSTLSTPALIPLCEQLAAIKAPVLVRSPSRVLTSTKKKCVVENCTNVARSRGLCKAHGGGQRCSVTNCPRSSQRNGLCIAHGGGKQCLVAGCTSTAQSKGVCKVHGGRVACRAPGCQKNNQGGGFCRVHGGGQRCKFNGGGVCNKWAQRQSMCIAHSKLLK